MSLKVDIRKKLKDMTLHIAFYTQPESGIAGILGASGCGKSMTLKCIAGIETPDQGRIVLNGRVLFDSDQGINVRIQDRRVGYLFQNYALFPHMTVRENVEMVLSGRKGERERSANEYLSLFGMEDFGNRYPSRLSGGQQQRAALARIMASKPDVLMLDEPFSALDYYLKERLQIELHKELCRYGKDVLLVTHDRNEIYRLCGQIFILDRGRVVSQGGVQEVFEEPGTVAAAKLTGCKNIAKIRWENDHRFYVPQWDMHVEMKKRRVPSDAPWIGIRAHYLRAGALNEPFNTADCHVQELMEDPFEITLILENGIWWKLSKERWRTELGEKAPSRLMIPEESIFFLKEC